MKKTKKGFTLVELVIVVAVMAVLVAVAIPTVSSITKSAKDSVNNTNAQTIESMIKLEQAQLSKDGDGTTAFTAESLAKAIAKAKLGITAGIFTFDEETGECKYVESAPGTVESKNFAITFSATKVTVKSSTETKDAKLDGTS